MFDDGVVFICNLTNLANNGDMPREVLIKKSKHLFEERAVGVSRQYQAKGVNERVDRLVRIPQTKSIHIGQYAMLGNGEQFRIDNVSHGQDSDKRTKLVDSKYYRSPELTDMPYTELTLYRLEKNYDVVTN